MGNVLKRTSVVGLVSTVSAKLDERRDNNVFKPAATPEKAAKSNAAIERETCLAARSNSTTSLFNRHPIEPLRQQPKPRVETTSKSDLDMKIAQDYELLPKLTDSLTENFLQYGEYGLPPMALPRIK